MKERSKAWMEYAARDLEAARKLVDHEYLANIVMFHAQQCIEKSMKAVLEECGHNVPRVYAVNRLYSQIIENTRNRLPITPDELDFIDDIYIDTRYPSTFGLLPSGFPNSEQAKLITDIAEKLYEAVASKLSL